MTNTFATKLTYAKGCLDESGIGRNLEETKSRMKLHKLSNGNWIDLSNVTAVVKLERCECWPGGPIHPARVIVHAGRLMELLPCDDDSQAAGMRDEIASAVNAIAKSDARE